MALVLLTLPLFAISRASAVLPTPGFIPNIHRYRFASIGLPESEDPGWAYDTASGELIMQVYEPLISYDHEDVVKFIPLLAKSVPSGFDKVMMTLTNTTVVDEAAPKGSLWVSAAVNYELFEWVDEDGSGALSVMDEVWFENLADHENSFQGVVREKTGNIQLKVERVRMYFEINTAAVFHPWTSDIDPLGQHTADHLTTEDVEFSFERSFVLDHEGGPMGLVMSPLLGIMTTREYDLTFVENRITVGHMIDNAIGHNTTHVWFSLVQTYGPFLQILTQSWAMIYPKQWDIALQNLYITDPTRRFLGFDATGTRDYLSWYGYTNPWKPPGDEIDISIRMCGTGPYKFDYLEENVRWHIVKFDGYWRGWPAEGRSPDDYIDSVYLEYYEVPENAFADFYAGVYDSVYVPRMFRDEVAAHEGVRTWGDMPATIACGWMMAYDAVESDYTAEMPKGTKKTNFFSDIHIREAFAHLINHTEYIEAAFLGEAVWPNSMIIDGLKYHNPEQVTYDFNLDEALRHFKLAFGGTLENPGPAYTQGFFVHLIYTTGYTMRQKYCEMLEYTLETALREKDPNFKGEGRVLGLWGYVIRLLCIARQLSNWMVGWVADFADADNFAKPYIHPLGDYALFQRIQYGQSGMKQMAWDLTPWGLGAFGDPAQAINNTYVDTLIDKAVLIDDSTTAGCSMREAMYYHLQEIYYQECPSYAIYQPTGRRWERNWVQGWYYNPINPYYEGPMGYCYHMWKGWVCHGDLDFRKDTVNGNAELNYLTCDYLDLFKFRTYYLMPNYVLGHRMRYADYDCNNQINFLDLFRFRKYYVYYGQWALCEGMCHWHWPTPP